MAGPGSPEPGDLASIRHVPAPIVAEARRLREELHRDPELAFREHRTARLVREALGRAGVRVVAEGLAGTGIVGLLEGARAGPTVALRAELDALPIQEEAREGASERAGVMHACGHDGHMAILLGTARLLAARRELWRGQVKFLFQPGEEQGQGARRLVAAGVLSAPPRIQAIFALHARPQLRAGQIELDGCPSAATNPFSIRVQGTGCHAAYPYLGTDPISVGCQLVCALQQVVSRQVSPFDAAVVTVGCFHAGTRGNVIPREARLRGTIRTRDPAVRRRVVAAVRRVARATASALGATARVQVRTGCPRVLNHPGLMELVRQVGRDVLGPHNVLEASQATMGGEDFAFYLEEQGGVPGCIFRLGVETDAPVHTPAFDFGHRSLHSGILMMSNIAVRYLNGDNGTSCTAEPDVPPRS